MEIKQNVQNAETKKVGKDVVVSNLEDAKYNLARKTQISLVKRSEVKVTDLKTFDKTKCRLDVVKTSRGLTNRLNIFIGKLILVIPNLSSAEKILLEERYNLNTSKRIIENVKIRIFKGFRQDNSIWMRYELFLAPTIIISNMFTNNEVVLINSWLKQDQDKPYDQKKFDFRIVESDEVLPSDDEMIAYEDWNE